MLSSRFVISELLCWSSRKMNVSRNPQRKGFLALPPELRELVYALVLASYKSTTLRAYKLPYRPHWMVRYHSGIISPPLLRVCKLVYFEAKDTLLKLCGPPTMSVEQPKNSQLTSDCPGYGIGYWDHGIQGRCVPEMRPLETALPMLVGVDELKLEIATSQSMFPGYQYAEDVRLHALLRWMGAVFAVRERPLHRLVVLVTLPDRFSTLGQSPELYGILLDLRSANLIIEFRRPGTMPPPISVDMDGQPSGSWRDVEQTWVALLETTASWPRQPWRPEKYVRLLRARQWFELWEAFGEWLRGAL